MLLGSVSLLTTQKRLPETPIIPMNRSLTPPCNCGPSNEYESDQTIHTDYTDTTRIFDHAITVSPSLHKFLSYFNTLPELHARIEIAEAGSNEDAIGREDSVITRAVTVLK
jgi:hypothetical protein